MTTAVCKSCQGRRRIWVPDEGVAGAMGAGSMMHCRTCGPDDRVPVVRDLRTTDDRTVKESLTVRQWLPVASPIGDVVYWCRDLGGGRRTTVSHGRGPSNAVTWEAEIIDESDGRRQVGEFATKGEAQRAADDATSRASSGKADR